MRQRRGGLSPSRQITTTSWPGRAELLPAPAGPGKESAMTELGDYLRACRARIRTEDVGLPTTGRRRVPGLRREELASLAGVSVDYIVRLEQGRVKSASPVILSSLAEALNLQSDEKEYLLRLAAENTVTGERRRPAANRQQSVSPATQVLLSSMVNVPALVLGRRMDILAWNELGGLQSAAAATAQPHMADISRPADPRTVQGMAKGGTGVRCIPPDGCGAISGRSRPRPSGR
jgi:transcriptional regulator with XRE-family HTH domain